MEAICKSLLEEGIRDTFQITKSTSFDAEFKSYILSSTFVNDIQNRKWDAGIDTITNLGVINFTAGADTNQAKVFQQTIAKTTSFRVSESTYLKSFSKVASEKIIDGFNECIKTQSQIFGLKLSSATINDTKVIFDITYIKQFNIADPKVTFFTIENGSNIINGFNIGDSIPPGTKSIICTRIDNNKPMRIILNTNLNPINETIPEVTSSRFQDKGVVLFDSRLNVFWTKTSLNIGVDDNMDEIPKFVNNFNLTIPNIGNVNNWRLPNISELISIRDITSKKPVKGIDIDNDNIWSANIDSSEPNFKFKGFNFRSGEILKLNKQAFDKQEANKAASENRTPQSTHARLLLVRESI